MSLQLYMKNEKERKLRYSNGIKQLMGSFTELGKFPHLYHWMKKHKKGRMSKKNACPSYYHRPWHPVTPGFDENTPIIKRDHSITSLDFDIEGSNIASSTQGGCITVHRYEQLIGSSLWHGFEEGENASVLPIHHFNLNSMVSKVKWSTQKPGELACAYNRFKIFDINHRMEKSQEYGPPTADQFVDVAFAEGQLWVAASYEKVCGGSLQTLVGLWDMRDRKNKRPFDMLDIQGDVIRSIQFDMDDKILYASGDLGKLYCRDIRNKELLQTWEPPECTHSPFGYNICMSSLLVNPVRKYQLAFYLDSSWVGVLDVSTMKLTHLHNINMLSGDMPVTPTWLGESSVYAIPNDETYRKISILDFDPTKKSPYYKMDGEFTGQENLKDDPESICCSDHVNVLTAHKHHPSIVGGSLESSLLVMGQTKGRSYKGEN